MKRLLLIPLLMLMLLPAFSGEESFLSVSLGWSYDTNVFSSPLPTGYDPADDYPNGGKYIKRHNLSLGIDYDLYFTEESKVGLSWSAVFGLPLKVVTIIPSLVDNELVHTYADETKNSMWSFCTGFGPVFRFSSPGGGAGSGLLWVAGLHGISGDAELGAQLVSLHYSRRGLASSKCRACSRPE